MESDKYITICQRNELESEVTLFHILNHSKIEIPRNRIDAAITHPQLPIIALRSKFSFIFYIYIEIRNEN